jgi:MFS family permease
MTDPAPGADRMAPFRIAGFRRYWLTLIFGGFSVQIVTVAVGWQIYDLTRDPFMLGLVGLSQFAPALLLVLVTGTVADRYPRRTILALALAVEAGAAAALVAFTLSGSTHPVPIFAAMMALGLARAFYNPARQSIVPNLVPVGQLARAVSITSTTVQVTMIAGPMMGGLLYGFGGAAAYAVAFGLLLAGIVSVLRIPLPLQTRSAEPASWATISAGFRFIWGQPIVRGAITLDLLVVLFGGAVALVPVYARDVLEVGPVGLGLLRAGPGIGAVAVGLFLIAQPIRDHAGHALFLSVAGFGVAVSVFAVSQSVWLSFAMLVAMGGLDMVSVYVRQTLVQLWTPDDVRGRVNAVNQVFIGASNEVGAFRAGTMAALIGPVAAVLAGGAGALAITALWARWFPELRRIRHLDRVG